ncbi:replication/maintenance protein RepL [Vibrio parahaemolyticus]|nr:replication/maintenance protein RepL [Vibrio parahaemolyticus]
MSQRYDHNPFVGELNVPVSTKQVKVSPLGKDQNVLVNQCTGEVIGTHVTTYKRVDAEEFVKLFTANIALTFDLKAAGIKAFNVLMWMMQKKGIQKDLIVLDKYTLEDFIEYYSERQPPIKLSLSTFKRGLKELEDSQIIAKNIRLGWYYINPNFAFNGDRIAFSTVIEKDKREKIAED